VHGEINKSRSVSLAYHKQLKIVATLSCQKAHDEISATAKPWNLFSICFELNVRKESHRSEIFHFSRLQSKPSDLNRTLLSFFSASFAKETLKPVRLSSDPGTSFRGERFFFVVIFRGKNLFRAREKRGGGEEGKELDLSEARAVKDNNNIEEGDCGMGEYTDRSLAHYQRALRSQLTKLKSCFPLK
jgi:hypothetical protein